MQESGKASEFCRLGSKALKTRAGTGDSELAVALKIGVKGSAYACTIYLHIRIYIYIYIGSHNIM